MLFILTGDIQTGKTRWLQSVLAELTESGAECAGVIAPGDWIPDGAGGYEKLGIFNDLLPEGNRIPFARRADLAMAEGSYVAGSQSAKEGLGWEIDDAAIDRVNAHFDDIAQRIDHNPSPARRLLVVDELGRLELWRNQGLTSALALLDEGPRPVLPHALVIVRAQLLDLGRLRLEETWGPAAILGPDEDSRRTLLNTVLS